MVTPAQRIEHYENRRKFAWPLFAFSIGAFINLLPFLNIHDLSTITEIQWLILGIDFLVLLISLANYIYYSLRIYFVRRSVVKRELS